MLLKPCPFCGGSASYSEAGMRVQVTCNSCLARGFYLDMATKLSIDDWLRARRIVVESWNKRVDINKQQLSGNSR